MKANTRNLVSALATIVLGILFLILRADVVGIAMTVLGIALIVVGVLDLANGQMTPAIVKIVIGILIIVFGWVFIKVAMIVFGALLLLYGLLTLVEILRAKSFGKGVLGVIVRFAQPVIAVLVGLACIFNQGSVFAWVFIVSGIFLIINGVCALIACTK